jgi:hypothetical protein
MSKKSCKFYVEKNGDYVKVENESSYKDKQPDVSIFELECRWFKVRRIRSTYEGKSSKSFLSSILTKGLNLVLEPVKGFFVKTIGKLLGISGETQKLLGKGKDEDN